MELRFFSEKVKALRTAMKGVTQGKLAKVVGAGKTTIGAWEAGSSGPNIPQLIGLADFFRLGTVDELIRPVPSRTESRVVPKAVLLEIADDAKGIITKTQQVFHEPRWAGRKTAGKKAEKAKKPKTSRKTSKKKTSTE